MIPITVKISLEDRDYIDRRIKAGEINSYGHCLRYLLNYRRKTERVVAVLKSENAVLRFKLKEFEENVFNSQAEKG